MRDDKADKISLHKRYLLWLYKTIKDELDKIERKFTQLDIDAEIQKKLEAKIEDAPVEGLEPFINEWKEYVALKKTDAHKMKFDEKGDMSPSYVFLRLKLDSVEEIVERRFGKKTLEQFKALYEEASIKRIMEDVSGRR